MRQNFPLNGGLSEHLDASLVIMYLKLPQDGDVLT